MTHATVQPARDWLASARASTVAWWLPKAAIVVALFAPLPARAVVWTVALLWMGTACILNAKRCGRTHCRYTGPYYLAMVIPVLAAGWGIIVAGFYGWLMLACIILLGSKLIWWTTERTRGKFS